MAVRRHVDPIARFMQEHDTTLMQLSALNRATLSLAEVGYSEEALSRVRVATKFLSVEVGEHNTREEEALFPVLERYVEGPTQIMRAEHKVLKRELRKLNSAIRNVRSPRASRASLRAVREQAQSVIHLFVNHIHKENNILFPLVQKFLTHDALREIARRMV
jgi:regulator of cell morphogenesis and NO signaling